MGLASTASVSVVFDHQAETLSLPAPATNARYSVTIARTAQEVASALRLRHRVFNAEMGIGAGSGENLEFDAYDFKCRHLIVSCNKTGETVGTYRLNDIGTAGSVNGFYSSTEFTIDDLPSDILQNGVEIGRACIAAEHRNTRVLFLLWKGLLEYLKTSKKRHLFGCCFMFTLDESVGAAAYRQLELEGHIHERFSVKPTGRAVALAAVSDEPVALPNLFNMYLRIGAKVCGPPIVDETFGSIDFFVVFDVEAMTEKYRRMFA